MPDLSDFQRGQIVAARMAGTRAGVPNQFETKSHISYCVTAKSHIIHKGIQENYPISYLLTHIPLLTCIYCKCHTPT